MRSSYVINDFLFVRSPNQPARGRGDGGGQFFVRFSGRDFLEAVVFSLPRTTTTGKKLARLCGV